MQTTLPWPVSPEFQDALVLATQRHQTATAPSSPTEFAPPTPTSVPRSASLMMKTRIAVRDTPHRFQVVPLREAPKNRDTTPSNWTRTMPVLRPSGVGLGLNVPSPTRGRERTARDDRAQFDTPKRAGLLRGLQGLSPTRRGSPDRKENRLPLEARSPTKRAHRLREVTLPEPQIPLEHTIDPEDTVVIAPTTPTASDPRPSGMLKAPSISRHGKSPSLGTIHHLLSSASTKPPPLPETPRVRCRKRTNTLSVASTKRYGVYTPEKLDFSPVTSERPVSTYSLGALLAAYSHESLPSLYSQDSFNFEFGSGGTRPLRVRVRSIRNGGKVGGGRVHPIIVQLLHDVDSAIGSWL